MIWRRWRFTPHLGQGQHVGDLADGSPVWLVCVCREPVFLVVLQGETARVKDKQTRKGSVCLCVFKHMREIYDRTRTGSAAGGVYLHSHK